MTTDTFNLIGTTIRDQYRIDEIVGEGGFGLVYRGFHLSFEQPIAIKCLKIPGHFTAEAKALFLDRFRAEGKMLSKLADHPSVVRALDFGTTTGPSGADIPYLVLEWLEGQDFETILRARTAPYSEREALTVLRPVLDAIAMAHQLGIAHRDIKPANLFLAKTARGEVMKVLDFGIAKAMQEGETATRMATRTSSGFSAFSPQYGAPEQFYSKKFGATGPWTDVYALGLLLVEMVTGKPALEGEEQAEFLLASTGEPRPTARAKEALVSDEFEALCARALAREPSGRPQSAGEMLVSVDYALHGVGSRDGEVAVAAPPGTVFAAPVFIAPLDQPNAPVSANLGGGPRPWTEPCEATTAEDGQLVSPHRVPHDHATLRREPAYLLDPQQARSVQRETVRASPAELRHHQRSAASQAKRTPVDIQPNATDPRDGLIRSSSLQRPPARAKRAIPPAALGVAALLALVGVVATLVIATARRSSTTGCSHDDLLSTCIARCDKLDVRACYDLGHMYENGTRGTPVNGSEAAKYYKRACDYDTAAPGSIHFYSHSCSSAAELYYGNVDPGAPGMIDIDLNKRVPGLISIDSSQAARYYGICCDREWSDRLLAAESTGYCCGRLGEIYATGAGAPKDSLRAKELLRRSCEMKMGRSCDLLQQMP